MSWTRSATLIATLTLTGCDTGSGGPTLRLEDGRVVLAWTDANGQPVGSVRCDPSAGWSRDACAVQLGGSSPAPTGGSSPDGGTGGSSGSGGSRR